MILFRWFCFSACFFKLCWRSEIVLFYIYDLKTIYDDLKARYKIFANEGLGLDEDSKFFQSGEWKARVFMTARPSVEDSHQTGTEPFETRVFGKFEDGSNGAELRIV